VLSVNVERQGEEVMKVERFGEFDEATKLKAAGADEDEDDEYESGLDQADALEQEFDEDDEEEEVTLTSDDDEELEGASADEVDELLVPSTHKEEADLVSEPPSPVAGYTPAERPSREPEPAETATVGEALRGAKKAAKKSV
jgi:hypothetical protein